MDTDNGGLVEFPVHPFTGLTAIGVTSRGPVWPVMGGAGVGGGDDTEGDDGDEGDEVDEGTDDGDGDEGGEETEAVDWQAKAAELQAQTEALQANLTRARNQAKKLREQQKATTAPVPSPVVATPPAPAKATARQQQAAPPEPQVVTVQDDSEVQRLQGAAVRAYAKAALISAGCDPDLIDAPLSKLRAADIDWDEDEDEPILDDYVDDMKAKYAKAFAKAEPVAPPRVGGQRRPGGIDQGAGSTGRPAQKTQSFGEKLWESGGGNVRAPRRPRG